VLLARRRRWRAVAEGLGAAAVQMFAIFWIWPGCVTALTWQNSQWRYSEDSIHSAVIAGLTALSAAFHQPWEYEDAFRIDRLIFTALFLVVCASRYLAVRDERDVIREVGHVSLVLLLGYAVSLYPWYMAWLIPIAALTDSVKLRRTILVSSAAILALYAFPYALLVDSRLHVAWGVLRIAAAFGIPVTYATLGTIPDWAPARRDRPQRIAVPRQIG
jgi:hypothetical protein